MVSFILELILCLQKQMQILDGWVFMTYDGGQ